MSKCAIEIMNDMLEQKPPYELLECTPSELFEMDRNNEAQAISYYQQGIITEEQFEILMQGCGYV